MLDTLIRPDILLIIIYIAVVFYVVAAAKHTVYLRHLMVSSSLALVWILLAKSQYGYNIDMAAIFGIALFPLFAWALGLFVAYLIYSRLRAALGAGMWWQQLLLFTVIYLPLLLTAETVAYYQFNITNLATAAYNGLPICGCIHAPTWMQAAYLLMGPVYFSICQLLGLEHDTTKAQLSRRTPNAPAR